MIKKERLVNTFIDLVSVPSPSLDEKAEAELVMQKLRSLGLEPQMDNANAKSGGSCGNVWAYIPSNGKTAPTLFFSAHLDSVAPATGTHVIRKGGVLYSDGTTTLGGDDKVGIAAILEALQSLQEDNTAHGAIQICFTVSEEIGCLGAVNLDKNFLKADYGYCLDADGSIGEITYSAPKLYNIEVTIKGKAAHAGLEPEKGINAIMLAAKALEALPATGRLDEETTLNINIFHGGIGSNIVCPEAKFVIDMRCRNTAKLEKLKDATLAQIREIVTSGGGKVGFKVNESCPAMELDKDHPCIRLAARAAKMLNAEPQLKTTGGCADSNFLCGHGLPCALLATGMANVHTTEEFLREEDLCNTARWVQQIIITAADN